MLKIYVTEGEMIPKGYGLAYVDHLRNYKIAYPLGINLIVRAWKAILAKLKLPSRTSWEIQILEAKRAGFMLGKKDVAYAEEIATSEERARILGMRFETAQHAGPGGKINGGELAYLEIAAIKEGKSVEEYREILRRAATKL